MNVLLFVYGTLRKEGTNHHFLESANLIEPLCWVFGQMFDTGLGYPVIKEGSERKVVGELYEITESELQKVDQLEDYSPHNETNEYVRLIGQVFTANKCYEAYFYVAGDQLQNCQNLVEEDDWISHCRKKSYNTNNG
jgi:gamma-glutamylcyclotransferase (GGCT)/AIG2-like uncharacterized protein YtfP